MKENLHFELATYSLDGSAFRIPYDDNYDFWVPLMKYYLEQSDAIEIHCWNEETETVEEAKIIFNQFEISYEYELTYFKGDLTADVIDYLLYNSVNKDGEFKWFSTFLTRESKSIFHTGHWATEFFAPNILQEEIKFIESVMPTSTRFNQYQDEV